MKWVDGGQEYNPLQQVMLDMGLRDSVRNGESPIMVRSWIDRGAKVNPDATPEAAGYTPTPLLHVAARDGRSTVLEVLAGADRKNLDIRDVNGRNALHVAALEGQAASAHVLLQMGLDAKAVDEHGFTPTDLAYARGHDNIINIIRSSGVEFDAPENMDKLRADVAATYPPADKASQVEKLRRRDNSGPQFPIR